MPGYDGKGPRGQGPLTGKGLGYCATDSSKIENSSRRIGRGQGGFGRGFGRGFYRRHNRFQTQPIHPEQEKDYLKQELERIEIIKKNIESKLEKI